MPLLEFAFRVAAFSQLGILIFLLLRHRPANRSYVPAAALFAGIACYLLAPLTLTELRWSILAYPVIMMASLVPVFFWYFSNAVFRDGLAPHPLIKWLAGLFVVAGLLTIRNSTGIAPAGQLTGLDYAGRLVQVAKLLWIAAAFATALRDWRADLVEPRRRLRRLIVFGGGCYILVVLVVELFIDGQAPAELELLNISLLLVAVTALSVHLLAPDKANGFAKMAETPAHTEPTSSPLAKQVIALMENERAYAEEGPTIDSIARRLTTQPHQLRRVINGELGYRNFNAFINHYRVREVARRLGEKEYSDTPLLTLALDAGFRSMAPFNRSFKDLFGVTPSDYRNSLEKDN